MNKIVSSTILYYCHQSLSRFLLFDRKSSLRKLHIFEYCFFYSQNQLKIEFKILRKHMKFQLQGTQTFFSLQVCGV